MVDLLHKLWNFEIREFKPWHYWVLPIVITVIAVVYVLVEVAFGVHPGFDHFTFIDFWKSLSEPFSDSSSHFPLAHIFPQLWIAVVLFCVAIRITVIISSYFLSKKAIGEKAFAHYFYTYFSSFIIGFGGSILLVFLFSAIAVAAGVDIELGTDLLATGMTKLGTFIDEHVPSLLQVKSYPLAIVITILVSSLPLYFVHWLSHKSRFVWYVFHRAHHCPQFLHPLAAPPAFVFEFLLIIPSGLVAIVVSKIVYTEPLIMEMTLWFTFGYSMEIFNHSIISYQFAKDNFFVRNMCRLFGDTGVYHLMHHSSIEGDEMINLSGGPLQIWDRLFGTYRKPYDKTPPLGLTNQPEIHMNPFRIIFSGVAQLGYELKMNKDTKTRLLIIFGDIYYQPPISKDFLKL